ncbi:hypothetical protein ACET3Z_022535 [Daucus carota]
MDFRLMGIDHPLLNTFYHILDDQHESSNKNKSEQARSYVRDAKAMATTPADVKEYPNAYVFVVDMPGLKSGDIKVQVEDENVLVVCGERKREEEEGVKYVRMERKVGRFMRKFVLPENADLENIKAVCQDGVLSVTVEKLPPPEPKKPKTIEGDNYNDSHKTASLEGCSTFQNLLRLPFPHYKYSANIPFLPSKSNHLYNHKDNRKHNYSVSDYITMDFRLMGIDHPLLSTFYHILDDQHESSNKNKSEQARSYVRDAKAMATTPADVKEYPNAYVFVVDMPGLKSGDIKVQVEDENVLVVCGERKREEEEGVKYVRMERKVGRFMRKFVLPENADLENIKAVCQDGVLSVTVEKLPPPEPKKPKTIEVQIA